MPVIHLTTVINAPRERVFDLARSIDAHQASTGDTSERALLTAYMKRLLEQRNAVLKRMAKSEEWKRFLQLSV